MKKIIFTLLLLIALKAYPQANFSRLGLGVSAGLTTAYTGFTYGKSPVIPGFTAEKQLTTNRSKVIGGSLDYYFTPFITGGLEYNVVELRDGTDIHNRAFISNFSSIEVRGNVAVGEFIDYSYSPFLYAVRNVNASIGLGFISGKNNVKPYDPTLSIIEDPFPFPRRTHSGDLGKSEFSGVVSVPVGIGYNLNLYNAYQEVKFVVGFNYKTVFTFSDDIDGYNDDPSIYNNKSKDIYTSFSVSLKYLFGPTSLYFK